MGPKFILQVFAHCSSSLEIKEVKHHNFFFYLFLSFLPFLLPSLLPSLPSSLHPPLPSFHFISFRSICLLVFYFHLQATLRKRLTSCRMAKNSQFLWKPRIVYNTSIWLHQYYTKTRITPLQ